MILRFFILRISRVIIMKLYILYTAFKYKKGSYINKTSNQSLHEIICFCQSYERWNLTETSAAVAYIPMSITLQKQDNRL